MRSLRINTLAALALSAFALTSCVNKEELKGRLDSLEERISKLEDAVIATNANALAASKLLKENTLILGYEKTEYGYVLSIEGEEVEIIFGAQAPGIVPLVGVDKDGNWIMSLDAGSSWTKIAGADNAFSDSGITPMVRVDDEGYWCISYDVGKTWNRITDAQGRPISATDGKQMAGVKTFFTAIEFTKDVVILSLASGETVTVPISKAIDLQLIGYTPDAPVSKGSTIEYEVSSKEVASAALQAPDGWEVILTDEKFTLTAPEQGENGIYTIGVTTVSSAHKAGQFNFSFTLTD